MGSNPTLSAPLDSSPLAVRLRGLVALESARSGMNASVTLFGMSQTPNDPAGTTHQFQNFANRAPAEKSGPNTPLLVGISVVAIVIVVAVVAYMMV